jgi:hypothetical protein
MDEEGFSASVTSIGGVLADFEDPVDASILPRTSSSTLRSISRFVQKIGQSGRRGA